MKTEKLTFSTLWQETLRFLLNTDVCVCGYHTTRAKAFEGGAGLSAMGGGDPTPAAKPPPCCHAGFHLCQEPCQKWQGP